MRVGQKVFSLLYNLEQQDIVTDNQTFKLDEKSLLILPQICITNYQWSL